MLEKLTLKDYELKGKKVLLRVDFNVPLNEQGNITSTKRIVEALPTIKYLREKGAKIILCSHLGRPEGAPDPKFSLKPVVDELRRQLKVPILFNGKLVCFETKRLIDSMEDGDIFVLENVRFDKGEEENSPNFAKKLASVADIYCNDAFGTMHREHASTFGVAKLLPNCVGFLVEKELKAFSRILKKPKKPFVVILGGAKIKDKINLISNLLSTASVVLVGGAMANTFLLARGKQVGKSKVEADKVDIAKMLLQKAKKKGVRVLLPDDLVVSYEFSFLANSITMPVTNLSNADIAMDIGPRTLRKFEREIKGAATLFWNGPMGVFEFEKFANGTNELARIVSKCRGYTIVGGGDSVSAVEKSGVADKIKHLSTGGGAALKLLEGNGLPCLDVITDKGEPAV